jgi:pimeloyl-ACP methyl ester carboxylesterase
MKDHVTTRSDATIRPFKLSVPESELENLRSRLAATRWPEKEPVGDWSQGAPLAKVQALCEYWRDVYDWRRCEAELNAWNQFVTDIDGVTIHFAHIRSPHADALPMIMTHGWPGSLVEFNKVVGPLTDPTKHGGKAEDAFHLVLPSLPGYGFSSRPAETGWNLARIARAWAVLMERLGYDRYVAQGGDWGAIVTHHIALQRPPGCIAVHANLSLAFPSEPIEAINEEERKALEDRAYFHKWEGGYAAEQSTRPQTIGYGLVDSPALLAAWIYEKLHCWTDTADGEPESIFSRDEILDNIMLYWLPGTGASAARLYWESYHTVFESAKFDLPFGITIFPREVMRPSRRWAEPSYTNLIHWRNVDAGGHFAAFEQPAIFTRELRDCFRSVRQMA